MNTEVASTPFLNTGSGNPPQQIQTALVGFVSSNTRGITGIARRKERTPGSDSVCGCTCAKGDLCKVGFALSLVLPPGVGLNASERTVGC